MSGKSNFFRYVRGEEPFNDFFVSLLAWSLDDGPQVLNAIHDDLKFTDKAEIVATQRNGLPHEASEYSGKRVLDWVVSDETKLVGYESKTGSDIPTSKQLLQEFQKLKANSRGREVYLFTFSDHSNQPTTISEAPAEWISWYDVAERILAIETDDKAVQILQQMLHEEDYDGFTGFTEFSQESRWLTKHGSEFVTLAYDVERHLDEIQMYRGGSTHLPHSTSMNLSKLSRKKSSTINQAYLMINFHPEGSPEFVSNYYRMGIFLPALKNDLRVYMDINPNKRDILQKFVREQAADLAQMTEFHNMHLRTSRNSFNSPDREFLDYESRDDIENVLSNKAGQGNWKRLLFGWQVSVEQSHRDIIRETVRRLQELQGLFYDESEYLSASVIPEF